MASTLVYYKNRATPRVIKNGQQRPGVHKKGEGPVIKRRKATPAEEKQIKAGIWIRTRASGKKPGDPGARSSGLKGRPKLKKSTAKKRK